MSTQIIFTINFVFFSPSLPASCSCILSISMGVVTMTWLIPAPQPANISFNTVSPLLLTGEILSNTIDGKLYFLKMRISWDDFAYPSLVRWCLKKSLAASLIAFSGVTRVRFTAAPEKEKKNQTVSTKVTITLPFRTFTKTFPTTIISNIIT